MPLDDHESKETKAARATGEPPTLNAQRLQALGTLVSGIAHDFNNILTIISGNAEVARLAEAGGNPRTLCALENILTASSRARDLVRHILSSSPETALEEKELSFDKAIAEALTLLRTTMPSTVHFSVQLGCADDEFIGDLSRFQSAVMNLVSNAVHALPNSTGTITVRTSRIPASESKVPAPHGALQLQVADNGVGMDSGTRLRAFDPFFTTRSAGNGLGLAMVHDIVSTHHGFITFDSEPGRGTSFYLQFPKCPDLPSGTQQGNEQPSTDPGQSILIVDDEEALAAVTALMLETLGYSVTIAAEPNEALRLVKRAERPFALILSDFSMPQMSGLQLAAECQRLQQLTPIVIMSGLREPCDEKTARELNIAEFLPKPFLMETLAETVARAIREKGPRSA